MVVSLSNMRPKTGKKHKNCIFFLFSTNEFFLTDTIFDWHNFWPINFSMNFLTNGFFDRQIFWPTNFPTNDFSIDEFSNRWTFRPTNFQNDDFSVRQIFRPTNFDRRIFWQILIFRKIFLTYNILIIASFRIGVPSILFFA